jgi:hypothetical protein
MKIGIIVDDLQVTRWQADALTRLPQNCEILVYNCTNGRRSRRSTKHGLYYLLNLVSLRTRMTAKVGLPDALNSLGQSDFAAEFEGAWQRLPQQLLERIAADQPSVLVKFGMGLLRVPSRAELPVSILSYHHGDPRSFRGRPAGFYELQAGRKTVGQVIQILSNQLDAGEVVAYGETKCHSHSYRKTMTEAYRCSPLLLNTAIANAISGKRVPIEPSGKVTRLPSNWQVVLFVVGRLISLTRHWAYGATIEKAWQVAEADVPSDGEATFRMEIPDRRTWRVVKCPRQYRFLADPFYHPKADGLLVEAFNKSTNQGEILHVTESAASPVTRGVGRHFSYPATLTEDGRDYLLPEISEWSAAKIYGLSRSGSEELGDLDVPGRPRLIDPTLVETKSGIYLFANDDRDGASVLRLWRSKSLFGRFVEHPASPIRISPAGSRMAGSIHLSSNRTLFRFGQDLRRAYGDGLIVFRIDALSPIDYFETEVGSVRLSEVRGPHTLNLSDGRMVFDFYQNRFTPLAGVRRLRSWINRILN